MLPLLRLTLVVYFVYIDWFGFLLLGVCGGFVFISVELLVVAAYFWRLVWFWFVV